MNSNHNQANDGEAKAKPEVIKLGLDLHARQVTECRQLDASTVDSALVVLRRTRVLLLEYAAVAMGAATAKSSLDRGITTRCFTL
jgi:hypothetical protein